MKLEFADIGEIDKFVKEKPGVQMPDSSKKNRIYSCRITTKIRNTKIKIWTVCSIL